MINSIILMGDIINSRKYDQKNLAREMRVFRTKISKTCNQFMTGKIVANVGDEYQCICKSENAAIALVFAIDEYFMSLNTPIQSRFVIATGKFQGNLSDAYGLFGEQLIEAHESLSKKSKNRKRVSFEHANFRKKALIEDLVFVSDVIKSRWLKKDYSLILKFIQGDAHEKISDELKKTKQQISKRYDTLQISGYLKLKTILMKGI